MSGASLLRKTKIQDYPVFYCYFQNHLYDCGLSENVYSYLTGNYYSNDHTDHTTHAVHIFSKIRSPNIPIQSFPTIVNTFKIFPSALNAMNDTMHSLIAQGNRNVISKPVISKKKCKISIYFK